MISKESNKIIADNIFKNLHKNGWKLLLLNKMYV